MSMTDEERAREIVRAYYDCDRDWTLPEMLMALIMDIRADQREKDAGIADGVADTLNLPAMHGASLSAAAIRKGGET